MFGLTVLLARERTVLLADTLVHENPTPAQLADIAVAGGGEGARARPRAARRAAVLFQLRQPGGQHGGSGCARRWPCSTRASVDFEYDGEMSADVALDDRLMRQLYPFCRLSGPANILIMPELAQRQYQRQAAAASRRRHGDRAAADRASPARCRSSISAPPSPISSTSPRSRRTTRSADRSRFRQRAARDRAAGVRSACWRVLGRRCLAAAAPGAAAGVGLALVRRAGSICAGGSTRGGAGRRADSRWRRLPRSALSLAAVREAIESARRRRRPRRRSRGDRGA